MDRRCLYAAVLVIVSLGQMASAESGGVNCNRDLDVLTLPLTLDWYPFPGGFHVSGGLVFNRTGMDLDVRSAASLRIGAHTYSATEFDNVQGNARFDRVAPYVGIGWSKAFGKEGRWGIRSDLGVAFLGRPKVGLSATGPIALEPTFKADLAREDEDIVDDLSVLRAYPIFSISLFYRF